MTDSEKLDAAFRDALSLDDDLNLAHAAYGVTRGWDSTAHMQLVAEIEDAFDIMLDTDDVIGMSSYLVAKDILRKYHVGLDD